MSTPSATKNQKHRKNGSEPPKAAVTDVAAPPVGRILDFDAIVEEHAEDERGYEVPVVDDDGEPFTNPDGTPTIALMAGNTSEVVRLAMQRNRDAIDAEREARPRDADGKLVELTPEERTALWSRLLRTKYEAGLIDLPLWRKDKATGAFVRIELTPDVKKALFDAQPHFPGMFWSAEVRRRETFRTGARGVAGEGEVARLDGPAGAETDIPETARAEARDAEHDG